MSIRPMLKRKRQRLARRIAVMFAAGIVLLSAAAWATEDPVKAAVMRFVQTQAAQQEDLKGADIEVEIQPSGVALPDCSQAQAFSPRQGQKLRPGRMTIGLRCQGQHDRYLPIRLKVSGNYLEVARSLTPGQALDESSIRVQRGDLGELPQDVVRTVQEALGKLAVRRLEPGTALRGYHLRSRPVVKRGQNVAVEGRGRGFVVKRDGVAMEDGGVGDTVRVRLNRREILEAQISPDGRIVIQR